MVMVIRIGRIVREDVILEMQPGESEDDAENRCVAMQDDLYWDAYDCEYWHDPAVDEEAPRAIQKPGDPEVGALKARVVRLETLLERGRDLIAEAMDVHIYDEANGEVPPEDCRYVAHIAEADRVLAGGA